eukprot:Rhum_TRINITY_DN9252_c0_g2::Rhum_TRINITY_DN9252_c0_g2_i1::g.32556::m.32556
MTMGRTGADDERRSRRMAASFAFVESSFCRSLCASARSSADSSFRRMPSVSSADTRCRSAKISPLCRSACAFLMPILKRSCVMRTSTSSRVRFAASSYVVWRNCSSSASMTSSLSSSCCRISSTAASEARSFARSDDTSTASFSSTAARFSRVCTCSHAAWFSRRSACRISCVSRCSLRTPVDWSMVDCVISWMYSSLCRSTSCSSTTLCCHSRIWSFFVSTISGHDWSLRSFARPKLRSSAACRSLICSSFFAMRSRSFAMSAFWLCLSFALSAFSSFGRGNAFFNASSSSCVLMSCRSTSGSGTGWGTMRSTYSVTATTRSTSTGWYCVWYRFVCHPYAHSRPFAASMMPSAFSGASAMPDWTSSSVGCRWCGDRFARCGRTVETMVEAAAPLRCRGGDTMCGAAFGGLHAKRCSMKYRYCSF